MKLWLWRSWFALVFLCVAFPWWCWSGREWGAIMGMGAWGALSLCWGTYMGLADSRAGRRISLDRVIEELDDAERR